MINIRLSDYVYRFSALLIPLATLILYLPFLDNPLVFDDLYFFMLGVPGQFVERGLQFTPRWLSYFSHGLTHVWVGDSIAVQRIVNLTIHMCCGLVLYGLLFSLVNDLSEPSKDVVRLRISASVAATIFVLHPAAVYAAGYLIQRTTLLATFFSISAWALFWIGLQGRRYALWAALPVFALAAWSKEHCVMAPAVSVCLLILHVRSTKNPTLYYRDATIILAGQFIISLLLAAFAIKLIGTPYELNAPSMLYELNENQDKAHLVSVFTQFSLFFKYLQTWAIPDASLMSIDMREQFASLTDRLDSALRILFFASWGLCGAVLLFRGKIPGLFGLSMLAPWLMFSTEIAAIRIQEVFVLYRSYIWIPLAFTIPTIALFRLKPKLLFLVSAITLPTIGLFAANKLHTMSHPLFVWEEAANLYEKNNLNLPRITGGARIYHNLGLELLRVGFSDAAVVKLNMAIKLRPDYAEAIGDRAAAYLAIGELGLALTDYDQALAALPRGAHLHAGRAEVKRRLRDLSAAFESEKTACELGRERSCQNIFKE